MKKTIGELLHDARQRLAEPAEAEILLAHAMERDRSWLYAHPKHLPTTQKQGRFMALLTRRLTGEPVAYLTGLREFWSMPLRVDQHTLIPRPETEHLIEFVLERLPDLPPQRVIDLGCGCGTIALALARERPHWEILASDRSANALALARTNAQQLGLNVSFLRTDWLAGIAGPFDLIISNPPYVAESDTHLGRGDLRFEPRGALIAGPDGLDAIRCLVAQARPRLCPGGLLAFEHGHDQGAMCRALLEQAGYHEVGTDLDLAGLPRFSHGRRNACKDFPIDDPDLQDHDWRRIL